MEVFTRNRGFQVLLTAVTLSALVLIPLESATASRNGTETKTSTFSVGFNYSDDGVPRLCSGALIAPQIIVTAAHCVINPAGNFGKDYIFLPPGTPIDAALDPSKLLPKVSTFYLRPGFVNTGSDSIDDLAFIYLDKALATKGFIKIASAAEISKIESTTVVSGYGYGAVFETGEEYSAYPHKYSFTWGTRKVVSESADMAELTSATTVACSGDSGSPITAKFSNGEEKLIGVLSGAAAIDDRCGAQTPDGLFHVKITHVAPFLSLLGSSYNPSVIFAAPKSMIKKITCIKGKVKKVLSGTNPKCPTGYKKV